MVFRQSNCTSYQIEGQEKGIFSSLRFRLNMNSSDFYNKHWFFKYKLHHFVFWAVYHFAWWTLYSGDPIVVAGDIFFSASIFKYLSYVVFQALMVYFNFYFLMPKLLDRGKYGSYILSVIATIIVAALLIPNGYYLAAWAGNTSVAEMYKVADPSIFHFFRFNSLPSCVSAMTLAMSIKLAKNWVSSREHQRELEKEKLETELKFLKSQFNPHFLFNTINSIFVLIHQNPNKATDTLAKFSELLRYQLYECNEPLIPIAKEIDYLKNFIQLEKLRLNNNIQFKFDYTPGDATGLQIAPFILMPFVENAFKHVSKGLTQDNIIEIILKLEDSRLEMQVFNTSEQVDVSSGLKLDYKGLGLKNVKRRLDLIYSEQYTLEVIATEDTYKVNLSIDLAPTHSEKVRKNSIQNIPMQSKLEATL